MEISYYESGKDQLGHYVEETIENEFGEIHSQRKVRFPLVTFVNDDGQLIFLQYNEKMQLLYDVCNYLNFHITISGGNDKTTKFKIASDKTRLFKAKTLRNYLCFMELCDYDYRDLSDPHVVERVCSFLRGDDYRSTSKILRTGKTFNNYLAVIRDFADYLNSDNHALNDKTKLMVITNDGTKYIKKKQKKSKAINSHEEDYGKPYLSPEEYLNLKGLAIQNKDIQALMLFHLMYLYGLRIGECLGLTEEDFVIMYKHYNPSPTILLRNRLSDNSEDQNVKMVAHPHSKRAYELKRYPHQKVKITMDFYQKITNFIENTSMKLESKGIHDKSLADIVSKDFEKEKNHYIFVNKYGNPLKQTAWNKRLKQYFIGAKIPIDVDVKKEGLNHRFRHGCAMYLLRFADEGHRMSEEQVAALLRNEKRTTIESYTKVILEDEYLLKQSFQDSLLREIPNL